MGFFLDAGRLAEQPDTALCAVLGPIGARIAVVRLYARRCDFRRCRPDARNGAGPTCNDIAGLYGFGPNHCSIATLAGGGRLFRIWLGSRPQ